jgi:hypothetical protein
MASLLEEYAAIESQLTILESRKAELKDEIITKAKWEEDARGKNYLWDDNAELITKKDKFNGVGLLLIKEEAKPVLNVEKAEKLAKIKGLKCYRKVFDGEIFLAEVQGGKVTEKELKSVMELSKPKNPYIRLITKRPSEDEIEIL